MIDYFILITLVALICLILYQLRIDTKTRERMFEVQMQMGQAQSATTKELPWSELKKIIDQIIDFTVSNYIIKNSIREMKEAELSLCWTTILNEVCTSVELSISDEIKRQILKNITEYYMTAYIKNSVQLVIVHQLQNNRNNPVNNKLSDIHKEIKNPKEKTK